MYSGLGPAERRPWGEPFSTTHQWQRARTLLDSARSDEEYALSLGFVSHLLVDVIAHNHFVPAHEKMWGNVPVLTHAVCEWAMDAHIRNHLFVSPYELMDSHSAELAEYVGQHFACPRPLVKRGVAMLAGAEKLLRTSRLAHLCYYGARVADGGMQRRFNYYLSETGARLTHIDRILQGEEPVWDANPHADDPVLRRRIDLLAPLQLRHRIPLPSDVFSEAYDLTRAVRLELVERRMGHFDKLRTGFDELSPNGSNLFSLKRRVKRRRAPHPALRRPAHRWGSAGRVSGAIARPARRTERQAMPARGRRRMR